MTRKWLILITATVLLWTCLQTFWNPVLTLIREDHWCDGGKTMAALCMVLLALLAPMVLHAYLFRMQQAPL